MTDFQVYQLANSNTIRKHGIGMHGTVVRPPEPTEESSVPAAGLGAGRGRTTTFPKMRLTIMLPKGFCPTGGARPFEVEVPLSSLSSSSSSSSSM